MGRGAQASAIKASDREPAAADAFNQQLQAQLGQTRNVLRPQYQNILNNPGLSAADKAAVTSGSLGALSSAFDALQQSAANRLARTRNSAGFGELADELARSRGREAAGAAPQHELAISNTAFNRQMAALQCIPGLYGVDTGFLSRAPGIHPRM